MNYTFDNIVGFAEEREELKRLCNIFNNRKLYIEKGARMPKGVIFYGEPGNGKTLFAKVMATMCDLKVIKIDLGNVVDDKSVCKWIKSAFDRARKSNSCTMILFDEIDKVLPDESEEYNSSTSKTILAQLLTQIDGINSSDNIIFVATCNNYHCLPSSLVRSGRIDKKIKLSYPNFDSRFRLIKFYQNNTKCTYELKTPEIAKLTVGFSCAAIASLINECVMHSDENGFVNKKTIYDCILEIKNEDIPRDEHSKSDEIYACRNLGAFIVGKNLEGSSYVLNLDEDTVCSEFYNNIISYFDDDYTGDGSGDDYDEDDCEDDCEGNFSYFSKESLLNTMCVLFGGYAAEELILNTIYDNTRYHLRLIDDIMFSMLENGMFGLDFYYNSSRSEKLYYSGDYVDRINFICTKVRNECYEKAKMIVSENVELIEKLMPELVEKRNIDDVIGDSIINDLGGIKKVNFLPLVRMD